MRPGIVFLIIIGVPTLLQVVKLAFDQRKRHDELVKRIAALEAKVGA